MERFSRVLKFKVHSSTELLNIVFSDLGDYCDVDVFFLQTGTELETINRVSHWIEILRLNIYNQN